MRKSVHTREYRAFLAALRAARKETGLTQVQLAKRLKTTQSIVSKWERGELRLDIVQTRAICLALGTQLTKLVVDFETKLRRRK